MGWFKRDIKNIEPIRIPTYQDILNEKPYFAVQPNEDLMVKILTDPSSYGRIVYQHVNWAIEYLNSDMEHVALYSIPTANHTYILRLACAKYLEENNGK